VTVAEDMSIEDVLAEMDAASREPYLDGWRGEVIGEWLVNLRRELALHPGPKSAPTPWQDAWGPSPARPEPAVERFPLKSGLPQRLLRDLETVVTFRADHEGTGEVEFDYSKVPMEHRLQALLSIMGCLSDRIELALGTDAYVNLLRGVIARRER